MNNDLRKALIEEGFKISKEEDIFEVKVRDRNEPGLTHYKKRWKEAWEQKSWREASFWARECVRVAAEYGSQEDVISWSLTAFFSDLSRVQAPYKWPNPK